MTRSLRRLARRYLPRSVRLKRVLLQRAVLDRLRHVRFALSKGLPAAFPYQVCAYSCPFIDYPGQEHVGIAKRHNQRLAAAHLDSVVIQPGETFSLWRLVRHPSEKEGYAPAAAFVESRLAIEVGGSICLLSTVLYNVALLGALRIVERHCHSIDLYGDTRYFEPGRDASIEYGYLDLRLENPHSFPVLLRVDVDEAGVQAALFAESDPPFSVDILVGEVRQIPAPERCIVDQALAPGERRTVSQGHDGFEVAAQRRILTLEGVLLEDLPYTRHNPIPHVIAVGPRSRAALRL